MASSFRFPVAAEGEQGRTYDSLRESVRPLPGGRRKSWSAPRSPFFTPLQNRFPAARGGRPWQRRLTCGRELEDHLDAMVFEFTRRNGVVLAQIVAPSGADSSAIDHSRLWNAAEAAEKERIRVRPDNGSSHCLRSLMPANVQIWRVHLLAN